MKKISLYFTGFAFVFLLAGCSNTESKIKDLIIERENRLGNVVKDLSLHNVPEEKKSVFTVNYTIITPEEKIYRDSIQIAQTKDEILSEFVWDETSIK